jgi:hypothetical protein
MKNLQHYLNFFVYRYNQLISANPKNKTEQLKAKNRIVDNLLERIKQSPKEITYQTYLNDKGILNVLESRLE